MKKSIQINSKALGVTKQIVTATSVFVSRLNLLPANVSPLGSFGFFGNPWLFLITIILFDRLVGGTYPGALFTYLGFLMYPILGRVAKNRIFSQLLLLPLASLSFFLISNAGVWWYWYDHTWADLLLCYSLAVPFYARTLFGDLAFGYSYVAIKQLSKQPLVNFLPDNIASKLQIAK